MRDPVVWDRERLPLLRGETGEGDLDGRLIAALREDGRASNSELARRFGVSEALVRQRLKRLISNGAIRHQAVADLRGMGLGHMAVVHVAVTPGRLDEVAEQLCDIPGVPTMYIMSGRYGLMFYLLSTDAVTSRALLDSRLSTLDGVVEVNVNTVVASYKFDGSTGYVLNIEAGD